MACTSTTNTASCDFTIVVDGTEFNSHREILSSTSAYFDALFRSNMRETKERRVELQGMTSETFNVVLNFIHQRVHGLTADNIDDIWEAANRLDIAIYLKEIEHFVIENLSIDNLWHIYFKAVLINSNNVKEGSLMFMKQNYEHVFRMKEFLNLPFSLVLSCIESDELNVRTEDSVLESILTWVSRGRYKPDRRDTGATYKEVKLQNSEGSSRDIPTSDQSLSVIKVGQICDSGILVQADETATDKPGINIRQHGQHDDDKKEDVTKCSRSVDRAKYLAKLVSSAKLTLATDNYLNSLLKNHYIIKCSDAHRGVQEALKYKSGEYPLKSATLKPLRKCSGKRNAMAFVGKEGLYLYDLESRTFSKIKLKSVKERYRNFASVVSLGSTLCFICEKPFRNCPFAKHKCNILTVLLLNENKTVSTLYEMCSNPNSLKTLFRVNTNSIYVKTNDSYASKRSRKVDHDLLKTVTLKTGDTFVPICAFQTDILMFKNVEYFIANTLTNDLTVNIYNRETKSKTKIKIPNVDGHYYNNLAIH
ncbi:uncharacterized protein LOC131944317 [Physella acuta]|uniref:uncharacterized protein LOC131944317 n=1 Tax=Physella acuta TaxID=109671 RepID=UPI0027DBFE08|nr:uncharacterized protein LOC131944317 [Physella acuta]